MCAWKGMDGYPGEGASGASGGEEQNLRRLGAKLKNGWKETLHALDGSSGQKHSFGTRRELLDTSMIDCCLTKR